ncbi:hypothetical protein Tco_1452853 [Tanacetum coccineum]
MCILHLSKCHFLVKEGIVLGHKISKSGIKVDRAKVDVIVKLPPPTMVKGIRSFLGHAGFYRRFIQDFSKIARPMTHLLEKTLLSSSLLSVNLLLKFLKRRAVLGQRKDKYLRPIHYAKFNIKIRDKKGAKNLAADHLSRLENPHQEDLVGMEMNDNFPHESLNMISLNPDNEPPWFADITNYLVGFVLIRLSGGVWRGRKLWISFKLATMVLPEDIMAQTTPPRKFSTPISSGPPYTAMPTTWSHTVTYVNVREKSHRGTKCPKIMFRFVRSLTFGAWTLWAHSRLQDGTDIFSWLLI